MNKHGLFKFEATKVGKDTALAQIIRLVEEARVAKPHPEIGRPGFCGFCPGRDRDRAR